VSEIDSAGNVHSQFGEDRILADVLALLPERNRWCVEFGAWDGQHFSNTLHLIETCGYNGVMIEADADRFTELCTRADRTPGLHPVQRMVGWEGADRLDAVLAELPVPYAFDVLSIDIDGNDFHVWHAFCDYRPKIVVIEFNPTIPSEVEYIQPADPFVQQGTSVASLVALGREKGYELAAATICNAIFVDARYFDVLGLEDNSVQALRTDLRAMTWMFTAYDGSVHLVGARWLPWHDTPMLGGRAQQVPWLLRINPEQMGRAKHVVYRAWRARRRRST
jgi:hypothetical protein